MKETICIFSAFYEPHVGGVENYTKELSLELLRYGFRVIIATSNDAHLPAIESPIANLVIYRLPCYSFFRGRLPLPKRNIEFRTLMHELEKTKINYICINTRFYPHSLLGAKLAQKKGITPIVIDHGSDYLTLGNPLIDPIIIRYEHVATKELKKYSPRFYAVSKRGSEWLHTFAINSNGEIPNAINANAFLAKSSMRDFCTEEHLPSHSMLVAFVGRLTPEKGIQQLIDAAKILANRSEIQFLIAGDGILREKLEATAPSTVHFLGSLSQADVSALLQAADIFCLPSRSEGFATVLLEAAAATTAPVITNVGGVDELIPNEKYGIILPDQTPGSIVSAIDQLYNNRDRLRNIAHNLSARVKNNYNWQKTADALIEAFEAAQNTTC